MEKEPTALPRTTPRWLHVYAVLLCAFTVFLLLAGAYVTSTGSGLSVPDWPLSYGQVMPPMVGGIFYEHGHRMVASTVGFLTLLFALLCARFEPRKGVRRLAYAALLLVCTQGLLGGLTVLLLLPPAVSVLHAFLAQTFFSTTVLLALVTSTSWAKDRAVPFSWKDERGVVPLRWLAPAVTVGFFLQLIFGAVMRHNQAGLAIPDFPLVFGRLWPESFPFPVAIHFLHRCTAYLLVMLVTWLTVRIHRSYPERLTWIAVSGFLAALVSTQVLLGAFVVWLQRPVAFASVHLVVGALCLGTSVWCTAEILRAARAARANQPPSDANKKAVRLAAEGAL